MTLLCENLKYLRKQLGLTQEQMAAKIGVKRSLIGAYEENRADPRLHNLLKFAEAFGVSVDDLLQRKLYAGEKAKPQVPATKVLTIPVDQNDEELITLVPQKAAAGYSTGYADPDYVAQLPAFRLPTLPTGRTYRAFQLSGDSMLPLTSGTVVIGEYLDSPLDIKNGETYVLATRDEGLVYKRVFNYVQERGKLFLVSDNKLYSPYEIEPEEVMEVWKAKAYISTDFPDAKPDTKQVDLNTLQDMVMQLQQEVTTLKRDR